MQTTLLPQHDLESGIDITSYGSLKESYDRQNHVLNNLAAAVYTCDSNGFIKSYNKAAVDLWGREPEIGKDLWCGSWKIFEPDGVTPLPLDTCPMAVALIEGKSIRGREIIVERPDGTRRNVMPHPDPIFDTSGKVVEAVNMLVDITGLKLKEIQLQESENSYKLLAEELKAALKMEEEFMSIASHELKTPITSIKLFVDLLQQSKPLADDPTSKHFLERVQIQVRRVITLIKELIDATKIKSGQLDLNPEELSLNQLIKELVNDVQSVTGSHNFEIIETADIELSCDRHRIEQVVTNLLTNAVKYSKRNSDIIVCVTTEGDFAKVSIQDHGEGIPAELLPKIFDRFFRAHKEDQGMISSVGLGLFISKDIITRHHGNIWVESVVGEGSVFHFTLPLSK